MDDFYKNYVYFCAKKRESPSAVAEAVGLSRTSPNGWKKGKVPRGATLERLADYFGVSVDELKGEKKEMPVSEIGDGYKIETEAEDMEMVSGLMALLQSDNKKARARVQQILEQNGFLRG